MVNTPEMLRSVLLEVCQKIKKEMRTLSSEEHNSVLRDNVEAIKMFHWDTVRLECEKMMPTLMTVLKNLIPKPAKHIPLVCVIASQLLKARHQRLGLVQRATSVMLYGNGSSKQVRACMHYMYILIIICTFSPWPSYIACACV